MIEICAHAGIAILVTQTLRTWEEHDGLYAMGSVGKKHIVTNARGGQSYHNFGLACDIVALDSMSRANWDSTHPSWKRAAEVGKSLGLEWGGDLTTFKDLSALGVTIAECRDLYPAGLKAIWGKMT